MPEPVVHISISDERNNNIISNIKGYNKKQMENLFHSISNKITSNISDFNIKNNLIDNLKYEIQFVKGLKDKEFYISAPYEKNIISILFNQNELEQKQQIKPKNRL